MAATATLKDSFDDGVRNASLWTSTGTNTVLTERSDCLALTTSTATGYGSYYSVATYDLTGSSATIQVVGVGNQSLGSFELYPVNLILDAGNFVFWIITAGSIYAFKKVASVNTQLATTTFNANTHRWLRTREEAGTTYWECSPDAVSWTVFASLANPFAVTSLQFELSAGTYAAEASGTTAYLDSLNIPPTSSLGNNPRPIRAGSGMSVSQN